jgi:hypothetical protein
VPVRRLMARERATQPAPHRSVLRTALAELHARSADVTSAMDVNRGAGGTRSASRRTHAHGERNTAGRAATPFAKQGQRADVPRTRGSRQARCCRRCAGAPASTTSRRRALAYSSTAEPAARCSIRGRRSTRPPTHHRAADWQRPGTISAGHARARRNRRQRFGGAGAGGATTFSSSRCWRDSSTRFSTRMRESLVNGSDRRAAAAS